MQMQNTICMKYQSLFSRTQEKYFKMSSVEFFIQYAKG